ncbi:MAG: HAD family hydrolase [Clostridia bacterium]|nr:HAD family hydrolase [Clostridia bacterium]
MEKLVIFDLDGTIIDSVSDIADSINVMLKKYNYPLRTLEEIKHFIGNGAKNIVIKSIGEKISEEKLSECLNYYNEVYRSSGSPKTKVYDGVKEVIVELKNRGYKVAILSNKPQLNTNDVYKRYLASIQFDMVVGQSENVKCKPDPSATLFIMKSLNVSPINTYFVGDGETDVLTSNNAKVNGISVLWGYRSKEELEQVGAKLFAYNPKDLLSIIK